MDWDEAKTKPAGVTVGENLETLSVKELEARIDALKAEIERVSVEVQKRKSHEAAASALFKR
jgi:uncharacterized small protein (DUF1192 family)